MWSVIVLFLVTNTCRCLTFKQKKKYERQSSSEDGIVFVCVYSILNLFCIAALIVGGKGFGSDGQYTGHDLTAEIYIPSTNKTCTLPNLPDRRTYSTVNGNLVCGGLHAKPSPGSRNTCIKFDLTSGVWTSAYTLDGGRRKHVSWTPQSGSGTYLMGDYPSINRTSSLLKPDGTVESGFSLRWNLRFVNIELSNIIYPLQGSLRHS